MTGVEVAIAAAVASSAIGAVGAIQQGNAAKSAADYNAKLQEREAEQRSKEGNLKEEAQRRRSRQLLARQRAQLAETGVGFDRMGTSLIEDSATFAELDALNIRYEAETGRQGLLAGANLSRIEGKNAQKAGYLKAGSTLISGAGRVGSLTGNGS